MDKVGALDPVNYDTLQLNRNWLERLEPQTTSTPNSLAKLCSAAICGQGQWAGEAVTIVPAHLASTLLREAVLSGQTVAMTNIIANWPLQVLCCREIFPEHRHRDMFEEEMGLNVMLFRGIIGLTRKCRIRLLDLRGFTLNWNFTKLIVQMWPLLSLRRAQRNVKKLTNLVLKTAGLKKDNRLAREIIPKLLEDLLNHDMAKHPAFCIHIPKGEKLVVKIDCVEFSTQNTFFMEYLMTNCLRGVTPLVIETSNIIIKSDLNIGDEILDSLAPFIAFRGQNTETLSGVWIENLEDNVFFITCQDLQVFSNLTALSIPNCNITLQEGRTRRRTSTRHQLTAMLGHFSHLRRLDISQNSFSGCLKEVLDAVVQPLEFLSLKECDLCDRDIEDLADSRHGESLRHIDFSRICGLYPDDSFAVNTATLLRCWKRFKNLSIVQAQQNQIMDSKIDDLCHIVTDCWPKLRGINLAENVLSTDSVLKLVRACSRTNIQHIRIPYAHNFLEHWSIFEIAREGFARRVTDLLRNHGRPDIEVQVSGLAYAVLGQF